jgi:hypothetical protein
MAVSNQVVADFLAANPGMSDSAIAAAMTQHGVTPAQMAQVTGLDVGSVQSRFDATQIANTPGMGSQGIGVNLSGQSAAPNYEQMVRDAYSSIGRTGMGGNASNIDQAGFDYWVDTLKTGASTPDAFNRNFQTAVTDYLTQNPNDQYSTHVKNFLSSNNSAANTGATGALSQAIAFTPSLADQTAQQKADEYNNLRNQGFSDSQIRAAADSTFGTQSDSDWSYLTNLASSTGATTGTTAASNVAATTLAAPDYEQMVRDAYGSIGRTGIGTQASNIDQAGFDGWVNALRTGQTTPEAFQRNFQTAVADYLVRNPADQYSTYVTDYLTQNRPDAVSGIVDLYQDVLGRAPDAGGLGSWYQQFGSEISPEERALFQQSAQTELDSRVQNLYTDYMGSGRVADQAGLDYWRNRFGNEIDESEREQFRQAASAELNQNFGTDNAGLLKGFKYAKDLGISDEGLKKTLGDDLYNQYKTQLKTFATTSISDIVADNSLTFAESQSVANLARDLGFTSQQLADLTGKDKALYDTILTSYDTNSKKIINDTLTGANILTDADRVVASYALEKQFGFTDEELSKATGVDVKTIKASLDPLRNFEADFSKIANNTDSTTQQLKDFVLNAKSNAAIDKLYGGALTQYENKIAELENKWSSYGTDAVQSENLFQQLSAQRDALGGQYFQGVFGDLMNSAALLVKKGVDTIGDLGQKDKFQTTQAVERITTADGRPVTKQGDQYFLSETDSEGYPVLGAKVDPSSVTTKYFKTVTEGDGENSYSTLVPLSEAELATVKDGSYQQKIGSVVIDKDTGAELTDTSGQLAFQRSGGTFTGKKHWLYANFTDEGLPYLTARQEKSGIYGFVSDVGPMIISIASMIPGPHQPFAMAANAALAASQKNYLGAVLSGLGAYGTFTGNQITGLQAAEASGDIINASQVLDLQNTASNIKLAQTAVSGFAALQQENLAGVINASLSAYGQTGGVLPSGVTTALQAVNLATALQADNIPAALTALGDLTQSKDLYVAAAAKNLVDALQSGNISNITQAGLVFGNSFQAANQARNTTNTTSTGGITDRVLDDATTGVLDSSGAAAFTAAKNAGATDAEALDAANTVTGATTGVQVNAVDSGGQSNVETSTFTHLPADQVVTERTRLAQDYASSLGKPIGKLTTQEVDDFVAKVDSAIAQNGSAVLKGASIQDILSGNYQKFRTNEFGERAPVIELTNLIDPLDAAGNVINMEATDAGAKIAGNVADSIVESITGLEGTTGKIVQQGLSTLLGGIGEQVADLSTSLGNIGLLNRNNAGVTAGKYLEDIGKRLQLPETKQALENWVSAVDKESTYFGKIASGVKGVFQNPLVLTEVVKEIGQEILPGALALRVAKYAGLAAGAASSTVLNALESAGSTGRQTYDEEIAKGTPPAEAARIADRKAGYAGIITLATSGITDAAIAKKYGAAIEDFLGKKASSTGGEFAQEGLEEGLIALATGKTPAEALTQSVVGSLVGAKTSGTIQTAADVQADLAASFASQGLTSSDGSFRAETIVPISTTNGSATTGTVGAVDTTTGATTGAATVDSGANDLAITNSVQTSLNGGASVEVAVGDAVGTAITNGADAAGSINSAVTTAIQGGADTSQVVASTITSAANAGADTTLAINSTVTSAITSGADASQVVASAITAGAGSTVATGSVINSSVTAAINAGGNASVVVGSAITAAANTGASVDAAVASSVSAAVKAGADVNTVIAAATEAATSTGNNVSIASDANTVTISNATNNTTTTVDTTTGVTTTLDSTNNVTTTVDGNTTTAVDGNANTTTQTTVDANNNTQTTVVADSNANSNTQIVVNSNNNTTTSTTVDSNNKTTTQTTVDANTNTQTTVVTDVNNNTQTTVTVNIDTGDLIDQKETAIPDGWKQPVIGTPVVPDSATPSSATASSAADAAKNAAKKNPKAPAGAGAGAGGFGLPVGMDLNPGSLYSRETQKAIDPLARVKEIQAEFERESIMQNVDPRLMQVMQQRQDPQQQSQQFDKDIGALSKLLMGKPDAPSASNYYSYGAEDSIDDILGGKAANYKEGGFVEPLKASGGSMALPLLAKSGGALGHYKGRENFKEGKHVAGEGDGQSDDIPAWLADGEFVFPADVVSALGNGSTKAGTDKLYEMMHSIRDRARSKGPKDLPPPALKSPLDYLKSSKRSTS